MSIIDELDARGKGHGGGESGNTSVGHETSDARVRPLAILGVVLVVLIVGSFIAMAGLLFVAGRSTADLSNQPPPTAEVARQLPPEPRIEQNPYITEDSMISEANARLESYGWVDERAGTAHIPVERAMELLIERGLNPQPSASGQ